MPADAPKSAYTSFLFAADRGNHYDMFALARVIRMIGAAIALVIVVGIVLVVTDAKESNVIVGAWLDVARFFTEPFRNIFDLAKGKEELQIGINWGIAALVYFAIAAILAKLLTAASLGRARRSRRARPLPH